MNRKMQEYNRGRDQGLDMAWRLLKDAGNKEGMELIAKEIRFRGKVPINTYISHKEMEKAITPLQKLMYETFLCMALTVLHDEFDFGKKRCLRFLCRWADKTANMSEGYMNWADLVQVIKEELDIDVPTISLRQENMIA